MSEMELLTGCPVMKYFLGLLSFLSISNERAIFLDRIVQNLFALPITLFCSWTIDGILNNHAAIITGTQGYPPNL